MDTRQTIEDYVHYRNQIDIQKLVNPFSNFNTLGINASYNNFANRYNLYNNCNSYSNPTTHNSNGYSYPWMTEFIKTLTPYKPDFGYYYLNDKPKVDFVKPLTRGDDVQFKQFTGLNPNEMSFKSLVEYKMINPFTRQPWPQFVGKIKPEYNGISMIPTHYSLTPDMKRKMTFTMAERESFKGYNQY